MDKVEKFCIILIPIFYIVIDLLSGFVPALENLTDEKGYLIVLSGLMVLIFVHSEKRTQQEFKFIRSDKIVKDLVTLLEMKDSYEEINILAVTGFQYIRAIKESGVNVKKLKILLRKSDRIETIDLPQTTDSKTEFMNNSNRLISEWKELQHNGQVSNLEISYYDFDTTIHFMILDNKYLFWGLLYPQKNFPGTDVLSSYIINNKSELGEKMISDFFISGIKLRSLAINR